MNYRFIALSAMTALYVAIVTLNVADWLGVFDPAPVPQIRETTRTVNYPNGSSVKIVCITQGSRIDPVLGIVPLPIDTGVPQVGDLYINTCKGVKP